MKKLFYTLLLGTICLSANAQGFFEGVVKGEYFDVTISQEPIEITYYYGNGQLAIQMNINSDEGSYTENRLILNAGSENFIVTSNHAGVKHYYENNVELIPAFQKAASVDRKGTIEKIDGVETTAFIFKDKTFNTTTAQIAEGLNYNFEALHQFLNIDFAYNGILSGNLQAIPLSFETVNANGKVVQYLTCSSVETKSISASEFSVPAGFELVKAK